MTHEDQINFIKFGMSHVQLNRARDALLWIYNHTDMEIYNVGLMVEQLDEQIKELDAIMKEIEEKAKA